MEESKFDIISNACEALKVERYRLWDKALFAKPRPLMYDIKPPKIRKSPYGNYSIDFRTKKEREL